MRSRIVLQAELVQRQLGQRSGGQGRRDFLGGLLERFGRKSVQEHEPQDQVSAHERPDRQHRIVAIGRVGHDHAAWTDHGKVELQIRAEPDLDDTVDTAERADLIRCRRFTVIDDQISACVLGQLAFSWLLTVVTTRAPKNFASWIAKWPTAPAPPATRIVLPSMGPSANRHRCAVIAGTPRLAPSSAETPSGSGTAWLAGTTVPSPAVPHWRPAAAR